MSCIEKKMSCVLATEGLLIPHLPAQPHVLLRFPAFLTPVSDTGQHARHEVTSSLDTDLGGGTFAGQLASATAGELPLERWLWDTRQRLLASVRQGGTPLTTGH